MGFEAGAGESALVDSAGAGKRVLAIVARVRL
jgi:hypothetical protein